jgi:cytochrome c-type biogenesis protein CcmH/NrfG
VLYETTHKSGVTAAIAQYRKIKEGNTSAYDIGPGQLARLGVELLDQKRPADAIEILSLDLEAVPRNVNTLNTLARAYREAGQTALATQTYERVIQLAPNNQTAIAGLKEMNR